jgi:hypothetical protein
MRLVFTLILLLIIPGYALAQEGSRRITFAAATDKAVVGLISQIEPAQLAANLTVKALLNQIGPRAEDELRAELAKIDPVGGPRWLDEQTCQVRLEVSGGSVLSILSKIAADHRLVMPAVAAEFWAKWFVATGTGTAAGVAPEPPADSVWVAVSPQLRRQAVAMAETDAAGKILLSVGNVELSPGHPVAQALEAPGVRQSVNDWLASRPVTGVEYRQNDRKELEVQVTLGADPSDFFDVLRAAVTARNDVPVPADEAGWAVVHDRVVRGMAAPVGVAIAPGVERGQGGTTLPVAPPDWANAMLDVTGSSGPVVNSLRTARAAEADAMGRLREQVMNLKIGDITVGQAAGRDPRLNIAVERALRGAVLYKTEYHADGSVVARMSLDLRILWRTVGSR